MKAIGSQGAQRRVLFDVCVHVAVEAFRSNGTLVYSSAAAAGNWVFVDVKQVFCVTPGSWSVELQIDGELLASVRIKPVHGILNF